MVRFFWSWVYIHSFWLTALYILFEYRLQIVSFYNWIKLTRVREIEPRHGVENACSGVSSCVVWFRSRVWRQYISYCQNVAYQPGNTHTEQNLKKQDAFAASGNKAWKALLNTKVSQGHKVIDLGVIWQGIVCCICMSNTKSLSLTVQKL